MNSTFGKLAKSQIKKGLYLFIVPLIGFFIQWLSDGNFPSTWDEWKTPLFSCSVPVLYYILSLLQNSDGEILKKENEQPGLEQDLRVPTNV